MDILKSPQDPRSDYINIIGKLCASNGKQQNLIPTIIVTKGINELKC